MPFGLPPSWVIPVFAPSTSVFRIPSPSVLQNCGSYVRGELLSRTISRTRRAHSVALVTISRHEYPRVPLRGCRLRPGGAPRPPLPGLRLQLRFPPHVSDLSLCVRPACTTAMRSRLLSQMPPVRHHQLPLDRLGRVPVPLLPNTHQRGIDKRAPPFNKHVR